MGKSRYEGAPRCEKTVLGNGVRVLTERLEHVDSVSLGIWVAGGSREEPVGMEGITHFLEHMLFKGTERRTAEEIAAAVDDIGGNVNGYTERESLCLLARTVGEQGGTALELLFELLLHSVCGEAEVEREKEVVLQEIRQVEDAPEDWVHDLLVRKVWQGHALGRPPLGDPEVIGNLEARTVREYCARMCSGDQIVVAAAGKVEHEEVVRLVERQTVALPRGGEWSEGERATQPATPSVAGVERAMEGKRSADKPSTRPAGKPSTRSADKPSTRSADKPSTRPAGKPSTQPAGRPPEFRPGRKLVSRPTGQVHLCLATPGCGRREEERHAFSVFDTILGGGASSRLFQEIRERRGLVYQIGSYLQAYEGAGLLTVEAGTGLEHLDLVLELIEEEVERLRREGPRPEEMERAKTQLKVGLALATESTGFRMHHLAVSEIVWGWVWPFAELVQRVEGVTAEEVHALARRSFTEGNTALVAIGPFRLR